MSKTNKVEIKLFEKVDFNKLQLLISSEDIGEELKNQLQAYYQKRKGDSVLVNYSYSKSLTQKGRLYAQNNLSLQNFKSEVRHALAKDIYYDIDMENAGPGLIMQYCKKHDIECPKLEYYVNNREEILKKIIKFHKLDRQEAKHLMIKLCYLGKYDEFVDKLKYLSNFSEEMKKISKEVCRIEKDIFNEVVKNKDKPNKKSTTLSITCQVLENKCLMAMYDFFKGQKINVGVLCFDGLMIEKNKKIDDSVMELLKSCQKYVFDKIGYKIKLVIKPMDKELEFRLPEYTSYVHSDKDAADKLLLIEGKEKFKYCQGDFYVYDERTGVFEKDETARPDTLNYYLIKNRDYLNVIDGKTEKSYGTDAVLMKKVINFILAECKDDHWVDKVANSSLGYLLFRDGIYDMKKCKFTKGFNPRIIFYASVPWDFPERDEEEVKNAFDISFGRLFEEPEPILAALARALAGDTHIKKFYFCPGKTNAGKSVLINMLQKAFGKYIGTFNAESLAHKKRDSRDEGQKNRWGLLLRFSRILMSNEIKMDESVDGNAIKKHSAGTDKITGRGHHGNETEFHPHYTIFCMLNDIPKIEPMDSAALGRLEYIEFPYEFVDKENLGKKSFYKAKDNKIDKKISDEAFIRGFTHILLDAYQRFMEQGMPEFDKETKDRWTSENKQSNEVINKIEEYYEVTGNKDDTVSISNFKKFREAHKKTFKTISSTRFNDILREDLALEEDRNSSSRYWMGIRERDVVE